MMKVHAYILCYNEEKIIKHVIDHYAGFCSRIFILDNESIDNSVFIAKTHPKVTVISWGSSNELNDAMHIDLKMELFKSYSRKGGEYTEEIADWVITCDMDELIYHPALLDLLADYKSRGITVPLIQGFKVVGKNEIDPDKSLISQYPHGHKIDNFNKNILFDVSFNIKFSLGCHPSGCGHSMMLITPNYKTNNSVEIALLHYKHIGSRAYEVAQSSHLRLSEINKKHGWGSHYKEKASSESCDLESALESDILTLIFNNDMTIRF